MNAMPFRSAPTRRASSVTQSEIAISRVLADVPAGTPGDGLHALSGWRFGLVSTLGADLGNTSLFPALASGGTLVILPAADATDRLQESKTTKRRSLRRVLLLATASASSLRGADIDAKENLWELRALVSVAA